MGILFHPLTGKRIEKLSEIAKELRLRPMFNIEDLYTKYQVDKKRLYRNFSVDLFFLLLPILLMIFSIIFYGITIGVPQEIRTLEVYVTSTQLLIKNIIGIILASLGIGYFIKTSYSYSTKSGFPKTDIADLMDDIYTSPVKGRPNSLKGEIVGRGVPGLIFSEDMMFRDSTGLIYLNYESLIPFFGNLIFALTKVKDLVGKKCEIEGWFVRGLSHWIELNKIYVDGKEIKSRVRLLGIIFGLALASIGAFIFFYI